MSERRVVLLGRTGAGKSSSGNNILLKDVFLSSSCGVSVTRKCQRGTSTRFGVIIQLIDSPGLFDTEMSQEDITREIVKCIGMTAPGPHAFVLVIRIDRFTKEEQDTVEHFKTIFGDAMLKYLLVLFTRKDDLIHDGKTIEEYLQKAPKVLKDLLESCNNRYVAFNNRGTDSERNMDVQRFLDLVEETVNDNGGDYYTNVMYQNAEKAMQERQEQLRQEQEEVAEIQRREIEAEYKGKVRRMEENQLEITGPLQEEVARLERVKKSSESSSEVQQLQQELKEMKALLEETRREAAEARAQANREAAERMSKCEVNVSACREQAREEVNVGADIVKGLLNLLQGDVMTQVFCTIGKAVGSGIAGVITAGFDKATQKITGTQLADNADKG